MVTPVIFLLSINCKKKECFIFIAPRDTAHLKEPMMGSGKYKEVTAVLKL